MKKKRNEYMDERKVEVIQWLKEEQESEERMKGSKNEQVQMIKRKDTKKRKERGKRYWKRKEEK